MIKEQITELRLIEVLKLHYGLDIDSIRIVQDGADANAYRYKADSSTGSYFVKLKLAHHDDISLSIIHLLHETGIKEIIYPILTRQKTLVQQLDNYSLIVYPYIDAPNGFNQQLTDLQWKQLGRVLRKVHDTATPSLIHKQLRKETYSSKWRESVRSFGNPMNYSREDDPISAEFKACFNQHIRSIHQLIDTGEKLSQMIQPDPDKYVLCHSDIHAGNVLIDNEESLYIIDWDEPILAPKERDLMFIGAGVGGVWNKPQEMHYFYEGYGTACIDTPILAYYRHERIVQDIAEFAQELVSASTNEGGRMESLEHFKAMFLPNNVVDIAFVTEL
ncbi:TPA: phosphotransferase [Legionella pneumophila]